MIHDYCNDKRGDGWSILKWKYHNDLRYVSVNAFGIVSPGAKIKVGEQMKVSLPDGVALFTVIKIEYLSDPYDMYNAVVRYEKHLTGMPSLVQEFANIFKEEAPIVGRCPFCSIINRSNQMHPGSIIYRNPRLEEELTDSRHEVCLSKTSDKWLPVCERHFNEQKAKGTIVRIYGMSPNKLDSYDKSLANKLKKDGLTVYQKPNVIVLDMNKTIDTLGNLIQEIVSSLIADNTAFSAHDVTTRLRSKINNGESEISGRPYRHLGSLHTQMVEHTEVKTDLDSLYASGSFPTLQRRNNSGGYFEYYVDSTSTAVPSSASPRYSGGSPTAPAAVSSPIVFAPPVAAPSSPYPGLDALAKKSKGRSTRQLVSLKYGGLFLRAQSGRVSFSNRTNLIKAFAPSVTQKEIEDALAAGTAQIETVTV